MNNKQECH